MLRRIWGAPDATQPGVSQLPEAADNEGRRAEDAVVDKVQAQKELFSDLRVWNSVRVPATDRSGRCALSLHPSTPTTTLINGGHTGLKLTW